MSSVTLPMSAPMQGSFTPNASSCTGGSTRQQASTTIPPALQVHLDLFKTLLRQKGYDLSNQTHGTDDSTLLYEHDTRVPP
jgi:hypothetical protein